MWTARAGAGVPLRAVQTLPRRSQPDSDPCSRQDVLSARAERERLRGEGKTDAAYFDDGKALSSYMASASSGRWLRSEPRT
jgi:hypothetical protein